MALQKCTHNVNWQSLQPFEFKFTLRDTPQHNNLVESSFPFIAEKARGMMSAAYIPIDCHGKVAIEAIKCATQVDGLTAVKVRGKLITHDEHVLGKNPDCVKNLKT